MARRPRRPPRQDPRRPDRRPGPPPARTGAEREWLRELTGEKAPLELTLRNGELVRGSIASFDERQIRLVREEDGVELALSRDDIRYLSRA